MKTFLITSIFILLLQSSCDQITISNRSSGQESSQQLTKLLQTDKAFSILSKEQGMAQAFLQYAAEDAIKLQKDAAPLIGKASLADHFKNFKPNSFTLTWEPLKGEVASSGDLGYTFGNWSLQTKTNSGKDTIMYGNYMSVWRKEGNGDWKFVLDGGNSTPAPTKMP